jgi:hypothetical protein
MTNKENIKNLNIHGMPYTEDIFSISEIKEINKWIKIYSSKLLFFKEKKAIEKLKKFDEIYCARAGVALDDLYNAQIAEIKRIAGIKFTDIQNEFNDTMFHYAENEQAEAYKRFEKRYLDLAIKEENQFPFKAVIASDMGLVRRKYLWL